MTFVQKSFGVETADAENVRIAFDQADLVLSFQDWRDVRRELTFRDVLAFRWEEFDDEGVRNDITYEITGSAWLLRQSKLHGVPPSDYAHCKLCFNACGVLDVLCRQWA